MSEALEELKASLEAAVATAIGRLDEETRTKLAESVERSTAHAAAGNLAALKVEANTVTALLWTEGNERGKQARRELVEAVSQALVKGLIAAL